MEKMNSKYNISLLDCTLRDGGYLNDWNFGRDAIINIFDHVVSANIDYIEIGFLNSIYNFDINRSIMPDTTCVEKIYGHLDRSKTQVVGMIDYGTCPIENVQPCEDSYLDGIRVIFKKHLRKDALEFCAQLKNLGYKVFTQAVSITSYNDEELLDLIKLTNNVKPFALSIVDTYGLLHKKDLFHYYELMDRNLDKEIGIGYHAHNNFQLGYANCIELMNLHGTNSRLLLCDGSIFGMGKGAGNAPTELLCMYLNTNFEKAYDISHLLEAIDVTINDFFTTTRWGYQLKYFIAASNDCHPNYVTYLLNKKTLSVKSINEILKGIEENKKLMYDQSHIENLYVAFQANKCDDKDSYKNLEQIFKDKKILLLGPGASLNHELDSIKSFIRKEKPIVVSINFIHDEIHSDFIFITNAKRYVQLASNLCEAYRDSKIIATSNVTRAKGHFDFVFDYETLIDKSVQTQDNSFIMLLKILSKMNVQSIFCAGLDGYSEDNKSNYYISKMEYEFVIKVWSELNKYVSSFWGNYEGKDKVIFLTPTKYKKGLI